MSDYSELKRLAEAALNDNGDYVALNDYGMAVPPAVVLDLIAEVEHLSIREDVLENLCDARFRINLDLETERDRLKAEVGRLKAGVNYDMEEIERIQSEYDKQFRKARDLRAERDNLKTEVEALRNLARELRGSAECINVHHCKSEQHDLDEPCKVLARIDAAMSKGEQP